MLSESILCFEFVEGGALQSVIPLKQQQERGKKIVWIPDSRTVPKMVARSSGIAANFLCDNSKYILGVDAQGSGKRIKECFEAAKEKHLTLFTTRSSCQNVRC